jgi:hypothetical protein
MATTAGTKFWWMVAKDKDKNDLLNTRMPDRFDPNKKKWDFEFNPNDPFKLGGYTNLTMPTNTYGLSSQGSGTGLATIDSVTNGLIKQQEAVTVLSRAFEELFTNGKDGFKAMFDQFLKGINKLAAELAAKAVIWAFLNFVSGGSAGTLWGFIKNSFGITKVQGMAQGGIVPSGYPNDTYPALLSSGETVLPKGISNLKLQPAMLSGDVRFVIEENQLVGILKKANTRKSLY